MLVARRSATRPIGPKRTREAFGLRSARCRSTPDVFAATLVSAERKGDLLAAVEAVTEARLLKLALPAAALEAGIRTFAAGGQWARAADMLEALNVPPALDTSVAVFRALAEGRQADRSLQLLESMERAGHGVPLVVQNLVVRTCAAGGRMDRALELLEVMVDEGVRSGLSEESGPDAPPAVEQATFATVVRECMRQGLGSKAEEVLDWREL